MQISYQNNFKRKILTLFKTIKHQKNHVYLRMQQRKWAFILILVAVFTLLPKSYFHTCHFHHNETGDHVSSIDEQCDICTAYFSEVYTSSSFEFLLQIFEEQFDAFYSNAISKTLFYSLSPNSRGPPSI